MLTKKDIAVIFLEHTGLMTWKEVSAEEQGQMLMLLINNIPALLAHIDHQQRALEWLAMRDMPLCDAAQEIKKAIGLRRCIICEGHNECVGEHTKHAFRATIDHTTPKEPTP